MNECTCICCVLIKKQASTFDVSHDVYFAKGAEIKIDIKMSNRRNTRRILPQICRHTANTVCEIIHIVIITDMYNW